MWPLGAESKREKLRFARSVSSSKPASLLHRFSAPTVLISQAMSSLQSNVHQVTSMAWVLQKKAGVPVLHCGASPLSSHHRMFVRSGAGVFLPPCPAELSRPWTFLVFPSCSAYSWKENSPPRLPRKQGDADILVVVCTKRTICFKHKSSSSVGICPWTKTLKSKSTTVSILEHQMLSVQAR